MADIERRRELLEGLLKRLNEWISELWLTREGELLCNARDMVAGALEIGDLGDDGAWLALLEMVLEEVVDDGRDE